jgi:hypothetical protein
MLPEVCPSELDVVDMTPASNSLRRSLWPRKHELHSFAAGDCAQAVDVWTAASELTAAGEQEKKARAFARIPRALAPCELSAGAHSVTRTACPRRDVLAGSIGAAASSTIAQSPQ